MDLLDIKIYRMTHIQNISHIMTYGITHKFSPNANPNYISIGDISLIDTRNTKQVYVNNGKIMMSGMRITLGNFIPFIFGVRMPMLYVVQHGGNFVEKPTPAKNVVYLSCRVIDIVNSRIPFYFSDGHATDNFTCFYDQNNVDNLPSIIDWAAIKTQYWGGIDNLEVKRKKQAEFLVSEDISPKYLADFGCYNNMAQEYLISIGIDKARIKIVPNAYY